MIEAISATPMMNSFDLNKASNVTSIKDKELNLAQQKLQESCEAGKISFKDYKKE